MAAPEKYRCRLLPHKVVPCVSVQDAQQKAGWQITAFDLPKAWQATQGEGVVIAVIDTGANLDHPDLRNNLLPGFNFIQPEQPPVDDQGHGTHVTGILVAENNDIGMVGVCPKAKVIPIKVLDRRGSGDMRVVADGVRYAADHGAHLITMSLGCPFKVQQVRKAIQYAGQKGVATFVAAGNAGNTQELFYPANYPETIAIGAVDASLRRAGFSCTGRELDFMAPGVDIFSTYPPNWYTTLQGTCIAAGSYVYTPCGPIAIESLQPGQTVFAFKDNEIVERSISMVHDRGTNKTYRLKAAGRSLRLTETHKVLAVDIKARKLEWVEVSGLQDRHRLLLPKSFPTQTNQYLNSCLTDDFCWLLAKQMGIDPDQFFLASWKLEDRGTVDRVYDLTVPDADCFVTEGIITHNSMAAPFAVGVAALLLSYVRQGKAKFTLKTTEDYREMFRRYTTPVTNGNYADPQFYQGFGIIDPRKFIEACSLEVHPTVS